MTRSFSARLRVYVVGFTAVLFVMAFYVIFRFSYSFIREEAVHRADALLDNTILRIDGVLGSVETAVNNSAWAVGEELDRPDSLYAVLTRFVERNPIISGSAVAFREDFYEDKGAYYSPYVFRDVDGQIRRRQLGTERYNYREKEWFARPMQTGKAHWSEPYYDTGGGEMLMTTYSRPLYDADNRLYGVFTADISLAWLTELVNSIHPYPRAYNLMIGREGTYIVHHRPERILHETIFSATRNMTDSTTQKIGRDMLAGMRGMEVLQNDDTLSYVFYAPIETTGWSVATVCPREEIFASLDKIQLWVVLIACIGLIVLGLVCGRIIRHILNPLSRFAGAARQIAEGNFSAPLPPSPHDDEMGQLRDAFEYMKKALAAYMAELRRTTAQKERIESELRIASEIQMGMIPKLFPPFPERKDIDLYAILKPAKEVGGDLYDFFIHDEKLLFVIGDVSGKGIPASLLMAVTRSLFRTIAVHRDTARDIVASLNRAVADGNNESNMFITLFVGILNLGTGELAYCNAGHNPPVLLRAGQKPCLLPCLSNIPIGVFTDFEFEEEACRLQPDDMLLLYTDGLTEAENEAKELYSDRRMLAALDNMRGMSAQDVVLALEKSVKDFAGTAEQNDDLTMLALQLKQTETPMKMELTMKNDIEEILRLENFVKQACTQCGVSPDEVEMVLLAVEEAVTNVIRYAYGNEEGSVRLVAERQGDSLVFELSDCGRPFDPTQVPEADVTLPAEERQEGGLGLFLVKRIMSEVRYRRAGNENRLTLMKQIR